MKPWLLIVVNKTPSLLRQYKAKTSLRHKRERWFYLLISPWLIGFLLFQAGPLLAGFFLAFVDWPLPQAPQWVGLDHFSRLIHDSLFSKTLTNTAYYALGSVPLGLALGLSLALLLNRNGRLLPLFRTIFFLPVVVSSVALVLLWGWIFNGRYGLLNNLLSIIGIQGPAWLQDEQWAMPALILMSLWLVGVNMVIYLAALQQIPSVLYEAAAMDGAGYTKRLRHITWPMLSPVTFYLLIVNLIGAFQVFTPTYILTQGGPNNATLTLPLYIYQTAFTYGDFGYASALATVLFLAIVALTVIQFRLADRWVFYRGGQPL